MTGFGMLPNQRNYGFPLKPGIASLRRGDNVNRTTPTIPALFKFINGNTMHASFSLINCVFKAKSIKISILSDYAPALSNNATQVKVLGIKN